MREIKFRAWDGKQFWSSDDEVYLLKEYDGVLWLVEDTNFYGEYEVKEHFKIGVAEQYTGLTDNSNPRKEICEGSIIRFLMAFPTTQTHVGDNIPRGSYTEPDEPFFHMVNAQVFWDEDRAEWSYSHTGKEPYGWHQLPTWYGEESVLPIIRRECYSLEYIKSLCGSCDETDCSGCDFLEEAGVATFDDLESVLNTIEVIGNIHENPELLNQ